MMENLPTPESRVESYLAKAAGMDVTPPEPKSRLELYLAKIAGMDVGVPEPTTREEHWLAQIVGIEPSEPLEIEGAVYIDNQKVDVRYLAVAAGVIGASLPEEPQNRKEMYWAAIASGGPTPPPTPTVRALKFSCEDGQTLGINTSYLGSLAPNLQYSTDGVNWTTWSDYSTTIPFGNGIDLYIRGSNTLLSKSSAQLTFVFSDSTHLVDCTGNVMHLFDYTQDLTSFPTDQDSHGSSSLFDSCVALRIPPSLPALELTVYCYAQMFNGCTNLEAIPALPATQLADNCYRYMFNGCSKIKMSATETGEYVNTYTFGTNPDRYGFRMFRSTGGTFTGAPSQQTYYTANTIIS